jgi:hypothetical protein
MGRLRPWGQFICAENRKQLYLTKFHCPQTKTFIWERFLQIMFFLQKKTFFFTKRVNKKTASESEWRSRTAWRTRVTALFRQLPTSATLPPRHFICRDFDPLARRVEPGTGSRGRRARDMRWRETWIERRRNHSSLACSPRYLWETERLPGSRW